KIREDFILLSQGFYDEDFELVKAMTGSQIQLLGGKLFPKIWKMQKADAKDEYTLLDYEELTFKDDLPDRLFTVSSLKSLRR
ncbi:MAG: outer membrane lipoprotein-sorting protein, partial [Desulfatiglandales bacterium]|nr:outer membrane lipoprotein-sorting protein [Desulfatiglandales bacterium]